MTDDAPMQTTPPRPPTSEEFDFFHEAVTGKLFMALWREAMGDEYPADVDPSSPCTRGLLAYMLATLDVPAGGVLVDLGCGRGGPGLWLAASSSTRLVGIDFSASAIALATATSMRFRLSYLPEFLHGTFDATGLREESADAVVSIDALPFAPDRDAALRELYRILRPGAGAIFTAAKRSDGAPVNPTWEVRIAAAGLTLEREHVRTDEPQILRRLYELWRENEAELRAEIGNRATDILLEEATELGPLLASRLAVVFFVRRPRSC